MDFEGAAGASEQDENAPPGNMANMPSPLRRCTSAEQAAGSSGACAAEERTEWSLNRPLSRLLGSARKVSAPAEEGAAMPQPKSLPNSPSRREVGEKALSQLTEGITQLRSPRDVPESGAASTRKDDLLGKVSAQKNDLLSKVPRRGGQGGIHGVRLGSPGAPLTPRHAAGRGPRPPSIITALPAKIAGSSPSCCSTASASSTPEGPASAEPQVAEGDVEPTSLKRRRPGLRDLHVQIDDPAGGGSEAEGVAQAPPTAQREDGEDEGATEVFPWLFLGKLRDVHERPWSWLINASKHGAVGERELTLQLRDKPEQDVAGAFLACIEVIERCRTTGGTVLVFCQRGISRSATIVLAYLMWRSNFDYEAALHWLKERRPVVSPNVGFALQLISWSRNRPRLAKSRTLAYRVDVGGVGTRVALALGPFEGFEPGPDECWVLCCRPQGRQVVWSGSEASEHLLNVARVVAKQLMTLEGAPERIDEVSQGHEDACFWTAMGLASVAE